MISIHNIIHAGEYKNTIKRWQDEAKKVDTSTKPTTPEAFEEKIDNEKEALRSTLKNIEPFKNETLIKIDEYFFTTKQNIESFSKDIDLNISQIKTINKNVYLALGGVETKISFEAKIFIEHLAHYKDFEKKVKNRELLSFSSLDSPKSQKILITGLTSTTSDWLMDAQRDITYHTKTLNITGVLFDTD